METFRYFLAVFVVVILPMVIVFWLVIHSLSDIWRKLSPILAYGVAGTLVTLAGYAAFQWRGWMIGDDLGFSIFLFAIGSAIYLASWAMWLPVKRHLDFRTFAGLPEVKNEKIALIDDGPFARVRHPRYLMVAIGIFGWAIATHYSGVYLVSLASIVGLVLIVRLEERDLVKRFGDEYRDYQRRVPQLVPRASDLWRFVTFRRD